MIAIVSLCIKPINHLIRPHLQQTTYQKVFIFFDILTVQIIVSCRRKANNRKKGGGWSKLTGVQRLLLLAEQCSKASGASLDMDTTGCQPVCIRVNPLMVFSVQKLSIRGLVLPLFICTWFLRFDISSLMKFICQFIPILNFTV